jgi:hypothetical protein
VLISYKKGETRMPNDYNTQTTNSNDNIAEQDLQNITGGCISCGGVTVAAGVDAAKSFRRAVTMPSPHEAVRGVFFTKVAAEAGTSFSKAPTKIKPCGDFEGHAMKYMIAKSFPVSH